MKYTFKCEHEDGAIVEFNFQDVTLDCVIQRFEEFLHGCGFSFSGNLDLVDEDEEPIFPRKKMSNLLSQEELKSVKKLRNEEYND